MTQRKKDEKSTFLDRLEQACDYAGVPFEPTPIARLAGPKTKRASGYIWKNGSVPKADTLFAMADTLKVCPRWLATGDGEMIPKEDPPPQRPLPPEAYSLWDWYVKEANATDLEAIAAMRQEKSRFPDTPNLISVPKTRKNG